MKYEMSLTLTFEEFCSDHITGNSYGSTPFF